MGMVITLPAIEGCGEAHMSECILETEMWGGKVKDGNGEARVREEDPERGKDLPKSMLRVCGRRGQEPRSPESSFPNPDQLLPLLFLELRGLLPKQHESL